MTIQWSAIIPTLNRAESLQRALQSLVEQNFQPENFEIIVVDNGSTDNTKKFTHEFINNYSKHNIRYFYEPTTGLLAGRHKGLKEATAKILTFFDDDVTVNPNFAKNVIKIFKDKEILIATGPSEPAYEEDPPHWLKQFEVESDGCKYCGQLSLLDCGEKERKIDPVFVWGLNFCIRKDILLSVGGFCPDGYPKHLLLLRGNGECAVTEKLKNKNIEAHYSPSLRVIHHTSNNRLTEEYFVNRMYAEGISLSYTHIRNGEMNRHIPLPVKIRSGIEELHDRIHNAYVHGYLHHHVAAQKDSTLLEWVLRPEYISNKSLPHLLSEQEINLEEILQNKYPKDLVLAKILQQAYAIKRRQNSFFRRCVQLVRKLFTKLRMGDEFEKILRLIKKNYNRV